MTLHTWPLRPYYPITRGSDGHIADGMGAAVDLACPLGVPWIAVHDATVTAAITDPAASDCGIQTDLEWWVPDEGHWLARYCHGAAQECTVGQRITAGQRIGSVGVTGNTTGPHLHLALWLDGERLRPEDVLMVPVEKPAQEEPMPESLKDKLDLLWNRLDRIQAAARGETTESIESLAEQCKQDGIVGIKVMIGLS